MTPAPANLHPCTALLEQSSEENTKMLRKILINSDYKKVYNELLVRVSKFFKFKEISYLRSESQVKAGSVLMALDL